MRFAIIASFFLSLPIQTYNTIDVDDDILGNIFQAILQAAAKPATKSANKAADRMWEKLCGDLRDLDCTGWERPKVMTFRPNPLRPGLAGYYNGEDVIYIRSNLYAASREEVLAHEMSHYADQLLGLLPPMPVYSDDPEGILLLCVSEKRAWLVSDMYNLKTVWGNPRYVVGSDWVSWYAHCKPFKDRLYPEG